jgi:hypothetical protein
VYVRTEQSAEQSAELCAEQYLYVREERTLTALLSAACSVAIRVASSSSLAMSSRSWITCVQFVYPMRVCTRYRQER